MTSGWPACPPVPIPLRVSHGAHGNVFADDLQPLFATAGPENTGKTLASLTALEQLGLIERRGSRYQPVEVTGKKDLSSAPVLRRLAEGEG